MPFTRKGERWFECHICGLDFPYSEGTRHYKSRRLVDITCADQLTQADYRETQTLPVELRETSEQPVANQGQAEDLYDVQDVTGGGGLGGSSAMGT